MITDASGWWLGDWLVYGEEHFADRYKVAVASSSLDYQTLRNYAWVARKFPMSRRREALSLQHHAEVAALAPDQQSMWLDRAQVSGWSKSELRRRLRLSRTANGSGRTVTELTIQLTVATERRARWEQAAAALDCSLSDWMAAALDRAAEVDHDRIPGEQPVESRRLAPVVHPDTPAERFVV